MTGRKPQLSSLQDKIALDKLAQSFTMQERQIKRKNLKKKLDICIRK